MTWRDDLSTLILARTGVEVPSASPQLAVVMRERVEALGLSQPELYVQHLEQLASGHAEWQRLIEAVTNHLTHFFRDPEQLASIAQVMQSLARQRSMGEPLRVWSAGCATGEEVYTLAILAHQHGLALRVHGTDVSGQALEVARRGIYDAWTLRHVAPDVRLRYFSKSDGKSYEVARDIRDVVRFQEHNLVRDPPLAQRDRKWDIIICRNVLIYYSPDVVRKILSGFAHSLVKDGALMLGASESILKLELPLRVELVNNRVVYYPSDCNETTPLAAGVQGESQADDFAGPPVAASLLLEPASPSPALAPASYIEVQADLVSLLTEGDRKGAEQLLRNVVGGNSADSVAKLSLGHIHLLDHDFEQARARYLGVIEHEPMVAEAHYFLGIVERRCQRLGQAFTALRRAVFLEPHFWAASYLLGATALRLGRHAACRAEWHRTLSLLSDGRGDLPLITHPLLHARFLETPERVMEVCRAGT